MAGLMVANLYHFPSDSGDGSTLKVAGISPESFIRNKIGNIDVKNVKTVIDTVPKTDLGEPVLKSREDRERTQPILINLSGGQIKANVIIREDWRDLITEICKLNKDILIITAVGNSAIELTNDNFIERGVFPSVVHPRSCSLKNIDPIIRVGATNEYTNNKVDPKLYETVVSGSNYGKDFVDILAAGQAIPILLPGGGARLAGGTSEASAIVAATVALLISCRPYATSQEIRNAIMENSNKYDSLNNKVFNGSVLNVQTTVDDFCFDRTEKNEEFLQNNDEL
jgi:hypothetical protein